MEHSSDNDSPQSEASGVSSLYLGLALAAMFVVGVAIGFLGRPLVMKNSPAEVVVTAIPDTDSQVVAQATSQQASSTSTETGDNTSTLPPTPTIMDFVLSDARHFQGSPDSPVTMVEFSDFK